MGKLSTSTKTGILIFAVFLFSWHHRDALYEIGTLASAKNADLSEKCKK